MALPKNRFEVQVPERPKEVDRQHDHQPESLDRPGMVAVDMVGMPVRRHLPEALVFDLPPVVTETGHLKAGGPGPGQRRHPDPFRRDGLRSAILLTDHRPLFERTNDPDRLSERGPGGQILDVPDPAGHRVVVEDLRDLALEDPPRILEQIPPLVLEHQEDVLVMSPEKRDEGGSEIQPVGQDEIEGPRISRQQTAHEPHRAADFILARPLGLEVEQKRQPLSRDHGQHEPVIILNPTVGETPL